MALKGLVNGMKKIQYGVWTKEGVSADEEYWLLFDTIEDAVSCEGDGCEVYRLEAKFVGRFKRAVKIAKIKKRKRKKSRR